MQETAIDTPAPETAELSYFQKRMDLYGITPDINKVRVLRYNSETRENEPVEVPVFREGKRFPGIDILVYGLDRTIVTFKKEGSRWSDDYCITRLEKPLLDSKGKERKYHIPKGAGSHPFFPPSLVDKYERKEQINTLVLTEGYFKAFKAAMHGFDIVGLTSITHYRDKDTETLHPDVIRIIQVCKPRRVVWLVDGDCLELSSKVFDKDHQEDAYKRPNQFFSSAKAIKQLLDDHMDEKFFAHVRSDRHENNPKGLDDLLIEMKGKEEVVLNDFNTWSAPCHYFEKIDMSAGTGRVHSYFHIKSVDDFVLFYSDREKYKLLLSQEFIFNGTRYRWDGDKNEAKIVVPGDAKRYFRVGDIYHEKVNIPNKYGLLDRTFHRRLKQTIIDDYGPKLVTHIPKYKAFCVVPDHSNYQEIIHSCYNLYSPFEHEPEDGECPATLEFLEHIFGKGKISWTNPETKEKEEISEIDLGLDYIQLLYSRPTQILPILCLVSKENATGKSTFAKWLRMIFTQNVAIVGNAELADNFNASWASKLLIICDEAKIDKQVVVEKVKSLSTADKIFMNAKGKDHVEIDFFGKFIFLTNNEENFIYASEDDVRYWIRKVNPIGKMNVGLLSQLSDEISSFLHFLNKRQLRTRNMHRAWFDPSLIKTEALKKVIRFSQPTIEKELRQHIRDYFLDFPDQNELLMTRKAIKEVFFKNKNYEMNYIHKVLTEQLRVRLYGHWAYEDVRYETEADFRAAHPDEDPEKHFISIGKRHTYARWEEKHTEEGTSRTRVVVQDNGRPYVFKVEDFLSPIEMRSRSNEDPELALVFPQQNPSKLEF